MNYDYLAFSVLIDELLFIKYRAEIQIHQYFFFTNVCIINLKNIHKHFDFFFMSFLLNKSIVYIILI